MADPAPKTPRINLRFLHGFCDDVPAMRAFYSERVGMDEQSLMDESEYGWVVYQSEGLQLMFHRWDDGPLPRTAGWAWQPGDGAGDLPVLSLGIGVPDAGYAAVVARVREAGDEAITPQPTWRQDSYWGWTVRDPAGNTVELYTIPAERPAGDPPRWPVTPAADDD